MILLSPQGRRLDQDRVAELALEPRLILLCGRYEGFDERIIEILEPELLSVGDFILSGGEVAAMVLIDAIVRLIPGVLGDARSAVDESFGPDGGLEYPQYTRPRDYRGRAVPEILLSGDHAAIARWRLEQAPVIDPRLSRPRKTCPKPATEGPGLERGARRTSKAGPGPRACRHSCKLISRS